MFNKPISPPPRCSLCGGNIRIVAKREMTEYGFMNNPDAGLRYCVKCGATEKPPIIEMVNPTLPGARAALDNYIEEHRRDELARDEKDRL